MSTSRDVDPRINQFHLNDGFINLLEISHPSFSTIRLCSDNVDCTHDGDVYTAFPFEMPLLDEREGDLPQPTLVIDNTDQSITLALRSVTNPATVRWKVIWMSDTEEVVVDWISYKIRRISYNVNHVIAYLTLAILATDSFPAHFVTPENAPGAFGRINS